MPKVMKSVRVDEKLLDEIEQIQQKSGGYITFAQVVENGLKKELEALKKIYAKK